jgi:hypothetical protein
MINGNSDSLLMIEPTSAPSATPVIDSLTRKMAGAWAVRVQSHYSYRGCHNCAGKGCSATSDSYDHEVVGTNGAMNTNSLAVHYLAYHREDVPADELAKVAELAAQEVEPQLDSMGPSSTRPKQVTYR